MKIKYMRRLWLRLLSCFNNLPIGPYSLGTFFFFKFLCKLSTKFKLKRTQEWQGLPHPSPSVGVNCPVHAQKGAEPPGVSEQEARPAHSMKPAPLACDHCALRRAVKALRGHPQRASEPRPSLPLPMRSGLVGPQTFCARAATPAS